MMNSPRGMPIRRTLAAGLLAALATGCGGDDEGVATEPPPPACSTTMQDALFADAATLKALVQAGPDIAPLRSTASDAHERFIDWVEAESRKISGMQVRSDAWSIQRWQPSKDAPEGGRSLSRSGSLVLNGQTLAIAGAVPYSLGAAAQGKVVYLPRSVPIGPEHAGKVILRDVPTAADMAAVAPPYAYLFQSARYLTPSLEADKNLRYERPYLAGGVFRDDLIDAGKVGAAAVLFGFDVPRAQVTDYFDPHDGLHYRVPSLFLGAEEAAQVKAAALAGHAAQVTVEAQRDAASTRNVIATLPGLSEEKIVFIANTDGNTWVQENGVAGILALARYFAAQPLSCRPKTFEFAFNSAHLHLTVEGTSRYTEALEEEYKAGKVAFTFGVEHLGTKEILPVARTDGGPGRTLAFTGKSEMQAWFVPENHELMQSVAMEVTKRRQLPRTALLTGIDASVADRLPKQCHFGGIGSEAHTRLIPSMAVISGPWSLWAPSFGADAIDFDLMRTQLLAIGDTTLALQGRTRAEIDGPYTAWRKARSEGHKSCPPLNPVQSEDAPAS